MATTKNIYALQDKTKALTIVMSTNAILVDFCAIFKPDEKLLPYLGHNKIQEDDSLPEMDMPLRMLVERIFQLQEECLNDMGIERKKVSRGMERDYCIMFDKLVDIQKKYIPQHNKDERLQMWAGYVEASNNLLHDLISCWDGCKNLNAPRKKNGRYPKKVCWHRLKQAWDKLSKAFFATLKDDSEAVNIAMSIYWEAAPIFMLSGNEYTTPYETYRDFMEASNGC